MLIGRINKVSKDFVDYLIQSTGGFFAQADFEILISNFECEIKKHYFTTNSESNLLRILKSILDRTSFLNDCIKYPHHVEIIIAISSNSNYLTDIIVRNPEYLYQLFNTEYLLEKISVEELEKEINSVNQRYQSFSAKLSFLRLLKRRLILKIGLNDILANWNLEEVTDQLTVLAIVINKSLFELCYQESLIKYGTTQLINNYCLVSLGKMGGNELNYSSDVDFMLIYDKNNHSGEIEYFDVINYTAQLFTQSASRVTDKGYLYRVDFRLRPDGKTSPLARTLSDMINYYESRGEEWERQMLIKMNYVCGDKNLFVQFDKFVKSYVYHYPVKTSPKIVIKKMKENIEKHAANDTNVKTFEGGIRDIEFSIQALQVLNGRRFKELKNPNSLETIHHLKISGLLSAGEADIYSHAYKFYRRIEHYQQLMNDTQTHLIPTDPIMINKLSEYLGYDKPAKFSAEIDKFRRKVRKIYESIIFNDDNGKKLNESGLETIQFKNRQRATKTIDFLNSGIGVLQQKQFDSRTIELFEEIRPKLFDYLKVSPVPDIIVDHFALVIKNVNLVSIWYKEFQDEKFFLNFLKLCEYSQFAIELITHDDSLIDLFITKKIFSITEEEYFNLSITQLKFVLSVLYTLEKINHRELSIIYSKYIRLRLKDAAQKLNLGYPYFIIALGSCGSNEMTFYSDVDLIVITDQVKPDKNIHDDFQNYILEANHVLPGVQIDFRLRPEGKSSPLVWSLSNYISYLYKRAGIWELQSLLKAKLVDGNEKLFNHFIEELKNVIESHNHDFIRKEIKSMYNKVLSESVRISSMSANVKKSKGTLISIQYILEYLSLLNIKSMPEIIGSDIQLLIASLVKLGYSDLEELNNTYSFFKNLELLIQNVFNQRTSQIPVDKTKKTLLAEKIGFTDNTALDQMINNSMKTNNQIFLKYLG